MKRVLVHSCCAHCAAYTIEHWRQQGYEVSALWYNPNIHPYTEHQKRLEAMQTLAEEMNFPLIDRGGYDIADYFRGVVGNEAERCGHCFRLRLTRTADTAREMGFDAFTTTLLISPHQDQALIRQIGEEVAEEWGVEFYCENFRRGWSERGRLTHEHDLYRQQYCGCIYSEWERYNEGHIDDWLDRTNSESTSNEAMR